MSDAVLFDIGDTLVKFETWQPALKSVLVERDRALPAGRCRPDHVRGRLPKLPESHEKGWWYAA